MDTSYRVEIENEFKGGPFTEEEAAHAWVAEAHPGQRYAIHTFTGRVGAGKIERYLPRTDM